DLDGDNTDIDGTNVTAEYVGTSGDGDDINTVPGLEPGNANSSNLNGTGEDFDAGLVIGTQGIGSDDISKTTFSLAGLSLADLDDMSFGVRLMSVGDDREGSCKLLGTLDIPDPPPQEDHFSARGISHVILLLENTDGDNLWVKIDDFGDGEYDLDNCLDAINAWIAEDYSGYTLSGLAVKQGSIASTGARPYTWYDLDGDNTDIDPNTEFDTFWQDNHVAKNGNIAGNSLDGSIDVAELCPDMAPPTEDMLISV
ncbi:MAG: hypothetical protein ACK5JT_07875, partial [Hyphomicrobiaceae bacterium]